LPQVYPGFNRILSELYPIKLEFGNI